MSWLLEKEVRRELPEEWNDKVPTEIFMQESKNIIDQAEKEGLPMRIIGGLGIALHCQRFSEFAKQLGRTGTGVVKGQEYSDLDFISYRKHRDRVKELFNKLGYVKRKATLSSAASERQIYYHSKGWFYVDVFFDQLIVANHPIDFRGRLELDNPTITVTDMLLEKVQMWEVFGVKDLKDCLVLLKAHGIMEKNEKEAIDASYVAKVFAQDWGFWYTATTNLQNIKRFMSELDKMGPAVQIDPSLITSEDRIEISEKINAILKRIDAEPKSFGWKMRAKMGTKKQWYNHVETPESVGGFGIWEAILRKGA